MAQTKKRILPKKVAKKPNELKSRKPPRKKGGTAARRGTGKPKVGSKVAKKPNELQSRKPAAKKGGTVARRGTGKPKVGRKVAKKPNELQSRKPPRKGGTVAARPKPKVSKGASKPNEHQSRRPKRKGGTAAARPKQSRNVAHGGGLGSIEDLRGFAEGMNRGIKKAARSKAAEKKFKNYKP